VTEEGAIRIYVMGYGNPGRLDDGLGPAFAERIEAFQIPGVTTDANYQLNVEDAATLAGYDLILLADASVNAPPPFELKKLKPESSGLGFSSHSLSPRALLGMVGDLFDAHPRAYLLGIRGVEFNDFGERLSEEANRNLIAAVAFVEPLLRQPVLLTQL
jgi:hydrogenase maturation protease